MKAKYVIIFYRSVPDASGNSYTGFEMIEPENVSQIVSGRLGDGWGTALEAVRSIAEVLKVPKSDIFWRVVTMRKREWKLETDRMEIVTTDAGTYVKGKLDSLKK